MWTISYLHLQPISNQDNWEGNSINFEQHSYVLLTLRLNLQQTRPSLLQEAQPDSVETINGAIKFKDILPAHCWWAKLEIKQLYWALNKVRECTFNKLTIGTIRETTWTPFWDFHFHVFFLLNMHLSRLAICQSDG